MARGRCARASPRRAPTRAGRARRLPTEAEYQRAAFGDPEGGDRRFPWGEAAPDARHGNFDFAQWAPMPVGSHPDGASAWGVHDLVGDGWEWTDTAFEGFPGFSPNAELPGLLRRLLRRQARRAQGGLVGDGAPT